MKKYVSHSYHVCWPICDLCFVWCLHKFQYRWRDPDPDDCPQLMWVGSQYPLSLFQARRQPLRANSGATNNEDCKCFVHLQVLPGQSWLSQVGPPISPPFPTLVLFSLKSPSLRLPTGELVTKVFFISSCTSSTRLPTLSCPQVSGSSYTWDRVTWHTATYTARNKVLVAIFKTLFVSFHDAFKKVLP